MYDKTDRFSPQLKVLILGAAGQDGPILAELIQDDFNVVAQVRTPNVRLLRLRIQVVETEILIDEMLFNVLEKTQPDFVVNFVSLSSVFQCNQRPDESEYINRIFVEKLHKYASVLAARNNKKIVIIQASSSEMFGTSTEPCDESTPFKPKSIYGKHKAQAHEFLRNLDNDHISSYFAIFFNHESPFRSPHFVSQKIATCAALYHKGKKFNLELGNIESARDWGYAVDFMQAIKKMMLNLKDKEYVISTGKTHSVKEMILSAFQIDNLKLIEKSMKYNSSDLLRPNDTDCLIGNSAKLYNQLGWYPQTSFNEMIKIMVDYQLNLL